VTVACDIMHLNGLTFLVTISRHLKFATTELLQNQKNETMLKAIRNVLNVYKEGDFIVTNFLMDGQLGGSSSELSAAGVNLNITGREEHIP
jgi:HKD family nuclease